MSKTFRPYDPDQTFLMPVSMKEWLPPNHLSYFISDVVDQLDLTKIMDCYACEELACEELCRRTRVVLE